MTLFLIAFIILPLIFCCYLIYMLFETQFDKAFKFLKSEEEFVGGFPNDDFIY
jgi:hypothetical protein